MGIMQCYPTTLPHDVFQQARIVARSYRVQKATDLTGDDHGVMILYFSQYRAATFQINLSTQHPWREKRPLTLCLLGFFLDL